MFDLYPDILTIDQLAKALQLGKNKTYNLVNTETICSLRIGRKILIPKICLIDYINSTRYNSRA